MDAIDNQFLKRPPGAIENIRKTYNLDKPGRLEEAINILNEWIQKQDHIIKKDFSKGYLETTLVSCKGSVEKAKKQIDRLCTMKTLMPKFFSKTNVKMELQSILGMGYVVPLPTLTEDNYRVLVIKFRDLKSITGDMFLKYFQFNIIVAEYMKANDYVNGFIVIDDYREVNLLELVTKMNTVELQQYLTILTEGYGARLKSINFLTDSKAIELLVKLIKQFVSEKISNRVQVRRTLEDLHEVVPKQILPVEYGGTERSIAKLHEELLEELSSEKHVEYMKMMNKACSDEAKRHAGKFNEEYMGMPGSFRCLSVAEYLKANDYVNGFIVIDDYREVNLLELVTKMNTVELQQYLTILTEGYGARLKSINFLTDSKAIELLVKLIKQFVSEKISNRVQVRRTLEDLHEFVPKEILPVEYGGTERSIAKLHEELVEELSSEKHVEYMKMMNKACSDEAKRHAGKFNEEYMGMPGSFRCLSVD